MGPRLDACHYLNCYFVLIAIMLLLLLFLLLVLLFFYEHYGYYIMNWAHEAVPGQAQAEALWPAYTGLTLGCC